MRWVYFYFHSFYRWGNLCRENLLEVTELVNSQTRSVYPGWSALVRDLKQYATLKRQLGKVLLDEETWSFSKVSFHVKSVLADPKDRNLNRYPGLPCGSSDHTGSLLRKTWMRSNGCSHWAHWVHLHSFPGPHGPQFIERRQRMCECGRGAVTVWLSWLEDSRNNPEFPWWVSSTCLEWIWDRVGSSDLNQAWNLALSFPRPQTEKQGWHVTLHVSYLVFVRSVSSYWVPCSANHRAQPQGNQKESDTIDLCSQKDSSSTVQRNCKRRRWEPHMEF